MEFPFIGLKNDNFFVKYVTHQKSLPIPKPKLELFSEAQRRGLAAHKTVWPQAAPTRAGIRPQ